MPAREKGTCQQQQRRAVQIITLTDPQTRRLSSPPTVQVNTNKSEEAKAIMAGRDPGSLWPLLLFKPYRWHDVKNEPVSSRVPISEWAHYLPFFTLNLLPACSGRCSRGVTHFYGLLTAVLFYIQGPAPGRDDVWLSALFTSLTDAFSGSLLKPSV